MKIIVMSDSHGNKTAMLEAVQLVKPDLILHLGDYVRDCRVLEAEFPDIPLRAVRGNGDFSVIEADNHEFVVEGRRLVMTHGHLFHVKTGLAGLINHGMLRKADVVLFGHTHLPYQKTHDTMLVLNPGSIGMGRQTYAVLELKQKQVTCEIINLE